MAIEYTNHIVSLLINLIDTRTNSICVTYKNCICLPYVLYDKSIESCNIVAAISFQTIA